MAQGKKTGGRKAGEPNKLSKEVKEELIAAFHQLNGLDGLVAWGKANPTPFYQLWGKLLPKDITVDAVVSNYVVRVPSAAHDLKEWQEQNPQVTVQ